MEQNPRSTDQGWRADYETEAGLLIGRRYQLWHTYIERETCLVVMSGLKSVEA
jgi:hypothetical protein